MVQVIAFAGSLVIVLGAAGVTPPGEVVLADLTVPAERLPEGCALSPSAAPLYPIRTNPWVGTDAPERSMIRERIEGPVKTPDPPALTRKELTAFRLHLADGVDEAYAAAYTQSARTPIVVYAMKLADTGAPADWRKTPAPDSPSITRISLGSIAAIVIGDAGECRAAIAAHLASLASR